MTPKHKEFKLSMKNGASIEKTGNGEPMRGLNPMPPKHTPPFLELGPGGFGELKIGNTIYTPSWCSIETASVPLHLWEDYANYMIKAVNEREELMALLKQLLSDFGDQMKTSARIYAKDLIAKAESL